MTPSGVPLARVGPPLGGPDGLGVAGDLEDGRHLTGDRVPTREPALEDGPTDREAPRPGCCQETDLLVGDDRPGRDDRPGAGVDDGARQRRRVRRRVTVGEQVDAVDPVDVGQALGIRGDVLDAARQLTGVADDRSGKGQ